MIKVIRNSHKALSAVLCLVMVLLSLVMVSEAPTAFADEVTQQSATGSRIIVSLGDSFSSGEGIPPFYGQTTLEEKVENHDWLAHRSTLSWSGQLTLPGVSGTMADHRGENWFFVATSGAETKHLYTSFKKSYSKIESIDALGNIDFLTGYEYIERQLAVFDELDRKGLEAEYVTLTLGGNDAQFADVVTQAVSSTITFNPSSLADKLNGIWDSFYAENGIRDNLYQAYHDIAKEAGPQAKIIVAGYPKLLNKDGKGVLFSKDVATLVNDSVTRFNDEIETLVNQCKAEGMRICFVDVEEAFKDKEAYSKDAWINKVNFVAESEDLYDLNPFNTKSYTSAYSVHPNEKGAKDGYRKCVQDKIDSIEADGGKSEWPLMSGSDLRDVVLVLDSSGSMSGTPIEKTKEASSGFIETVFKEDSAVGVVAYNSDAYAVSQFCKNETYLNNVIGALGTGGRTNIDGGLTEAQKMLETSTADQKLIVLMSDGVPNEGRTGDELVAFSDTLKEQGIYIYTLGFFSDLSSSEKAEAQKLLEGIASEGCHFEVDDAENLVYFFGDIADQIQGQRYIYIRIACPVDVTVEYGGEKLTSKDTYTSQRTDFGTMTFEENEEEAEEGVDNRIKVLRLKEGTSYDITIEGNGKGKMDYTIGFMDENGEYSDMREFNDIKITKKTEISTVAVASEITYLKVDEDGDGKNDLIYRANAGEEAELIETNILKTFVIVVGVIAGLIVVLILIRACVRAVENKSKSAPKDNTKGDAGVNTAPTVSEPMGTEPDVTAPVVTPEEETAPPVEASVVTPEVTSPEKAELSEEETFESLPEAEPEDAPEIDFTDNSFSAEIPQSAPEVTPSEAPKEEISENIAPVPAEEEKMNFCHQCGKQKKASAKFCPYCGTPARNG